MNIYPAIDILNGQCVRLYKGHKDTAKTYATDPVKMAKYWVSKGAKFLHIVDLDGSFDGESSNLKSIQAIRNAVDVPLQIGGGIRSFSKAESLIKMGYRIILGTMLVKEPELSLSIIKKYPTSVIASIDCLNGQATTDGWVNASGHSLNQMIEAVIQMGIREIVYTDISKDGTLEGPNLKTIAEINTNYKVKLIASGGIGSTDDILALRKLNVYGVIVGKALYENRFSLDEIMEA